MIPRISALLFGCAVLLALPVQGEAQDMAERRLTEEDTRAELRTRLDSLQQALAAQEEGTDSREEILTHISQIRMRLQRGDFRAGDALRITVAGDSILSGSYRLDSRVAFQPGSLPAISLDGVLFSEADEVIETELAEYLRNPEVRVEPLLRVGVLGAVNSPGFYDLSPGATVADALMAAGGLLSNAEVEGLKYGEDGEEIAPDQADPTSLTLVDLMFRNGNRIYVPEGKGLLEKLAPYLGVAGSLTIILTRI